MRPSYAAVVALAGTLQLVVVSLALAAEPTIISVAGSRFDELAMSTSSQRLLAIRAFEKRVLIWKSDHTDEYITIDLPGAPSHVACNPKTNDMFVVVVVRDVGEKRERWVYAGDLLTMVTRPVVSLGSIESWSVAFSESGEYLVISGASEPSESSRGFVRVVKTLDWSIVLDYQTENGPCGRALSLTDGKYTAFSTVDSRNKRWIWEMKSEVGATPVALCAGYRFSVARDSSRIAIFDVDEAVIMDMKSRVRHVLPRYIRGEREVGRIYEELAGIEFIPGTSVVVVAYARGGIAVWDVSRFNRIRFVAGKHICDVRSLAVAANGQKVAVGGLGFDENGKIELWSSTELLSAPLPD